MPRKHHLSDLTHLECLDPTQTPSQAPLQATDQVMTLSYDDDTIHRRNRIPFGIDGARCPVLKPKTHSDDKLKNCARPAQPLDSKISDDVPSRMLLRAFGPPSPESTHLDPGHDDFAGTRLSDVWSSLSIHQQNSGVLRDGTSYVLARRSMSPGSITPYSECQLMSRCQHIRSYSRLVRRHYSDGRARLIITDGWRRAPFQSIRLLSALSSLLPRG